jgi:hypothetical protein
VVIYEYRHPCLRYSLRRVFVPELTTYIDINGGSSNGANRGTSVPTTTPAHYEDEMGARSGMTGHVEGVGKATN